MKNLLALATVAGILFFAGGNKVSAESAKSTTVIEGTISSYECGDNCYLTIKDKKGKDHTGLCSAPLCQEWNHQAEMPDRYKGRRVKVTVGRGTRFDGSGNAVDTFDAFTEIELLK